MKLKIQFTNIIFCVLLSTNSIAQQKDLKKQESAMNSRKIETITKGNGRHWVGDGFPVNNMISYNKNSNISPFLLLDYAGPAQFAPSDRPRGVDQHPHRGFETVTIVYDGELEHRDTAGNSGKIGPGDVQWMTAARGILHEEKHSTDFTRKGGKLEMIQLWVNLPAKYKMSAPRYQEIQGSKIPTAALPNNNGVVRVIAGNFAATSSPVKTFTPINIYDVSLKKDTVLNIPIPNNFNAMLLVLHGKINIGDATVDATELAIFNTGGDVIAVYANDDAKILFISGEPINEPIVGAGPFVMNTEAEIEQAFLDFRTGKF